MILPGRIIPTDHKKRNIQRAGKLIQRKSPKGFHVEAKRRRFYGCKTNFTHLSQANLWGLGLNFELLHLKYYDLLGNKNRLNDATPKKKTLINSVIERLEIGGGKIVHLLLCP